MSKPTAIVYIDGLNLHRRLVQSNDSAAWVDYVKLIEIVLRDHQVIKVRLFTTNENFSNPASRQKYLNYMAKYGDRFQVHLGRFRTVVRIYPKHPSDNSIPDYLSYVKVRKTEEKGSDVALGSYMVFDAMNSSADCYVVLSSDTDFEPALRLLNDELNVEIGLICPTKFAPKIYRNIRLRIQLFLKPRHVKKAMVDLKSEAST